ncbi:hypothetical protein RJT34_21956 [Clitoria ternatea]|uniref:TIR domain-containing protein n=1 Tax=Clitoria ternatea TaxID=43366 RepID=A0AAN9IV37_CLITE
MSSFTSSGHTWIYDVFINFRGEDTRNNFVSHLHASLANAGISTFIDDKLERGSRLSEELLRAIRGSRIALVVFSKTYTASVWCLMELEEIMLCHTQHGQVVVPIFYDVEPSDVRHQRGPFGEALKALVLREYPEFMLSRLNSLLTRVANLSGWDIKNYRSEAEQLQQIVKDIRTKLDLELLDITDFPVGLESRLQEMIGILENHRTIEGVCKVGIWGMGGLGKTTLAKAIYNRIGCKFKDKSFIENIREVCEKESRGCINLQEQLLANILKTNVQVHSTAEGITSIKKSLNQRGVFIVLDDVSDYQQLKSLEIVRQSSPEKPEKRSRLWAHEDVRHVLANQTGTMAIEGLALKFRGSTTLRFDTKAFKKMKRLRLFQLDHVQLFGDYQNLPKDLRWLYWQGFPLKHIPSNFDHKNVVAIDVKYSGIKQVWKKPQLMEKLKILNLSHSKHLTNTPDFSNLPKLEKLILKDCPSLINIHESIVDLSNLLLMNLKDCTGLSNLPRGIYQLKSLQTLILSGCLNIDKLEEDLGHMESLTTLIAEGTAVKEMPRSIVQSKSIGYISLCGYKGLARDIFPSLIWSWMSPTMNPISCIPSFGSMSSSLVSMNAQNNILGEKSRMISSLSKLRCLWVQCNTEIQLSQELKRILDDTHHVTNLSDLATTHVSTSHILEHSLKFLLIGVGSYCQVFDTLSNSIAKELTTNGSTEFSLPGDNFPYWSSHAGEGHSVLFKIPHIRDWFLKGMILCVVYSSTCEKLPDNCLISIFVVNYTKCTIQIYKRDTIISFNDDDWQGIISNLGPDDKVEICVAFGCGLIVKTTTVYLLGDTSIIVDTEPSSNPSKRLRKDL